MNIFRKLITGGKHNISRLHDEKGRKVLLTRAVQSAPRSVASWVRCRVSGVGPELPWFTYQAIAQLEQLLRATDRVVEFGSGMSTVWFARRTAHVTTIENARIWQEKISAQLARRGLTNALCLFALDQDSYVRTPLPDGAKYDVAIIDGYWRLECLRRTLGHLSETPLLVIDDTDKNSDAAGGEMREVEALIDGFAKERGLVVKRFTDFSPTSLFVKETLIAYHPSRATR